MFRFRLTTLSLLVMLQLISGGRVLHAHSGGMSGPCYAATNSDPSLESSENQSCGHSHHTPEADAATTSQATRNQSAPSDDPSLNAPVHNQLHQTCLVAVRSFTPRTAQHLVLSVALVPSLPLVPYQSFGSGAQPSASVWACAPPLGATPLPVYLKHQRLLL